MARGFRSRGDRLAAIDARERRQPRGRGARAPPTREPREAPWGCCIGYPRRSDHLAPVAGLGHAPSRRRHGGVRTMARVSSARGAALALGVAAALAPAGAAGQAGPANPAGRQTVVAGAHYRAGWFHRLLLGAHYCDLWTTPLEVEVLDLSRFAGGLTPSRCGGRRQTKVLRFSRAY